MTEVSQVDRVMRRIEPELEEPYFMIIERGAAKCSHIDKGVTLDEASRTAICRGCKQVVDLFDALMNYAESERRLVLARERVEKFQKEQREKNERNRARMKFVRKVMSSKTKWKGEDSENMEEDGHILTLDCGHQMDWDRTLVPAEATCPTCRTAAKQPQQQPQS